MAASQRAQGWPLSWPGGAPCKGSILRTPQISEDERRRRWGGAPEVKQVFPWCESYLIKWEQESGPGGITLAWDRPGLGPDWGLRWTSVKLQRGSTVSGLLLKIRFLSSSLLAFFLSRVLAFPRGTWECFWLSRDGDARWAPLACLRPAVVILVLHDNTCPTTPTTSKHLEKKQKTETQPYLSWETFLLYVFYVKTESNFFPNFILFLHWIIQEYNYHVHQENLVSVLFRIFPRAEIQFRKYSQ